MRDEEEEEEAKSKAAEQAERLRIIHSWNKGSILFQDPKHPDYAILKITTQTKDRLILATTRFYYINLKNKLGAGTFGAVFKAYLINPDTGALQDQPKDKHFVAKLSRSRNPKEAMRDFQHEYNTMPEHFCKEPPISIGQQVILISEFFKGQDLKKTKTNELDTVSQAQLAMGLVTQANLMWHNTPSTGTSKTHFDLKNDNIQVYIDPTESKNHNIEIIDYGLALQQKSGYEFNPNNLYLNKKRIDPKDIPAYFAPEAREGKFGITTDIYMLVEPIRKILQNIPKIISGFPIKRITSIFLSTMKSKQYYDRTDPELVLRFFVSLNNFSKISDVLAKPLPASESSSEKNPISDEKSLPKEDQPLINETEYLQNALTIEKAKLLLLSAGLWNKKYKQYNFSENLEFWQLIITLHQRSYFLTPMTIEKFLHNNGFTKQLSDFIRKFSIKN